MKEVVQCVANFNIQDLVKNLFAQEIIEKISFIYFVKIYELSYKLYLK